MPRNLVPRPEARGTVGKSTRKWVEGFFDYVTGALRITPQGNISSSTAQEALYELDNEKLGKTENAVTATKLAATFKINGVPTDGSADINVPAVIAGAENNIIDGRQITSTSGLQVTISAGRENISENTLSRIENTVPIPARSAALVCDKSDGTTEAIFGSYPLAYVDNNTVGLWIFNQAPGASVPNSAVGLSSIAVANAMVPTGGITRVDGRCDYAAKFDGTSGSFASQNSTGFPVGATARESNILWTCKNSAATECIVSYGGTAGSALLLLTLGGKFVIGNGTANFLDSGFLVTNDEDYFITFKYNAGVMKIYINGRYITSASITLTTVAGVMYVGRTSVGTAYFTSGIVHFVSIRNALKTDAKTGEMSNKLLLPCFYVGDAGDKRNIITDMAPSGYAIVARVLSDSTLIKSYNTKDYGIGRREKAVGGNRRKFLGWISFSGTTTLTWTNPFISRKLRLTFVWKDTDSSNESGVTLDSSANGLTITSTTNNAIAAIAQASGAAFVNGAWRTTGFIGCYAEVLEDFEEV